VITEVTIEEMGRMAPRSTSLTLQSVEPIVGGSVSICASRSRVAHPEDAAPAAEGR
jgi:hypothetical protein